MKPENLKTLKNLRLMLIVWLYAFISWLLLGTLYFNKLMKNSEGIFIQSTLFMIVISLIGVSKVYHSEKKAIKW